MKTDLPESQRSPSSTSTNTMTLLKFYTHNTELKKQRLTYAKECPELCQFAEDVRFEIDKHRIVSASLLPIPWSGERLLDGGQKKADIVTDKR